ncbi:hypothetical protein Mro03_31650 [Microbispora rosea subsp. rosea]|nr:hypothetical protein Mro03_31650 [Microbispora rosea subsp. rosea]
MPHWSAQYGQWVAEPTVVPAVACDITGPGACSEIGMDPMVLTGGFTAGSLLLPLCYKAPTALTSASAACERPRRLESSLVLSPLVRHEPGKGGRRAGARERPGKAASQTRAAARLGADFAPSVRM